MSDASLRRSADRLSQRSADEAYAVSIGTGTVHGGYNPVTRDLQVVMDSDGGTLALPIAIPAYVPVDGDRVLVAGPVGAPHIVALVDRGVDVGIKLTPTAVEIINPGNTERRDLLTRAITCNGLTSTPAGADVAGLRVRGGGLLNDGVSTTTGQTNMNGPAYANSGLTVAPLGATIAGLVVQAGGIINQGGYTGAGPSERRLKRDLAARNGLLEGVVASPPHDFRYLPDAFDDVEEELRLDPETWRLSPNVDDLPADCVMDSPAGRSPEHGSMLYRLWGAVGELAATVAEQAEQITALTTRLEALEVP